METNKSNSEVIDKNWNITEYGKERIKSGRTFDCVVRGLPYIYDHKQEDLTGYVGTMYGSFVVEVDGTKLRVALVDENKNYLMATDWIEVFDAGRQLLRFGNTEIRVPFSILAENNEE